MRKITKEEFIRRSRLVHGEKYDYSSVILKGMRTKVKIGCPDHGPFEQDPKNHTNGNGCPKCGRVYRYNTEEFVKAANRKHNNRFNYDKTIYTNSRGKVTITCPEHGEFHQIAGDHISGKGCSKCSFGVISQDEFIHQAVNVHGPSYDYSKVEYKSKHTPITIICQIHGEYTQLPHNHLSGKGCPGCNGGIRFDKEIFIRNSASIHGNKYDYSKVIYQNVFSKVTIVCPIHGEFEQKPVVHYNHNCGCPKCGNTISHTENDLLDQLERLSPNIIRNSRSIIPPFELDGFFPDHNIAIEYCGLYWHGELSGKDRNYHLNKMRLCEEVGIRLITIFEDEWKSNQTAVINRVKHAIGKSSNRIGARKCTVREINLPEARDFLNQYHLQGYSGCRFRYGLFFEAELVGVMTFALPSRAKGIKKPTEGTYEISRFATSRLVSGGGSKLLSAFERDQTPKQIFTFADLRWGDGHSYLKMGFEFDKDTKPNYWYTKGKKRTHRFSLRKSPNDDQSLTEWENRQIQGWDRIWDCGNRKFVKTYTYDA